MRWDTKSSFVHDAGILSGLSGAQDFNYPPPIHSRFKFCRRFLFIVNIYYKPVCLFYFAYSGYFVGDVSGEKKNHTVYAVKSLIKHVKEIRRIVGSHAATNLTLKSVKGQDHGMLPSQKACYKNHPCQISRLYHSYFRKYGQCLLKVFVINRRKDRRMKR